MKITFIGNQGNNSYRLCKWLREAGVDVRLYIMEEEGKRSGPELIDRELEVNGYPSWICLFNNKHPLWFIVNRKMANSIKKSSDIIVTAGFNGLLSINLFNDIPIVHWSHGSEVTDWPLLLYKLKAGVRSRIASFFARNALSKASLIITQFLPTMRTLEKLRLDHKMKIWGFPEDVRKNQLRRDETLLKELDNKYHKYEKVFLWLSRINYIDRKSSNYKGPERFLEAFRKIVIDNQYNVKAIIGDHGLDIVEFKKLISKEGLETFVEYVPHLPYWKLLTYLSIKNAVIFDEIDKVKGEMSGLARDALSVGAIVVKAIDEQLIELCFGPECPIINADDIHSCYAAMKQILGYNEDQFVKLKNKSWEWANEYLHYEENVLKFVNIMRGLYYRTSLKMRYN